MSLRDLVTGSDACTPDDGAGPSNAFAGLADTLLGSSSKDQERLREIPGFHGLPGSSEAHFAPQRPEDAAFALAEGAQVPIPGLIGGGAGDVEEFMRGGAAGSRARPKLPWHAEFQDLRGAAARQQPGVGPSAMPLPAAPLMPFFHAFFNSAKAQLQFQPLPSPKMNLSVEDQCRIRDRSTIMARHIFMDRGDAFADEQVGRLLQSLHIDPRGLPGQMGGAGWDQIFRNGPTRFTDGPGIYDAVTQSRLQNRAVPDVDRWADQFADLNLYGGLQNGDQMADEFLKQAYTNGDHAWAEEFSTPGAEWADEFGRAQATAAAAEIGSGASQSAAMEQTRALRDTLAASKDPKFQNSQFLQFVSKMSRGEIILEDNQAKEVPGAATGSQWADEHAAQTQQTQFEDVWSNYNQQGEGGRTTWADEFQQEAHPPHAWADQFSAENAASERWAQDFAEQRAAAAGPLGEQDYVMSPDNPFLSDLESFARGKELFRNGLLSEAMLALEAEVQRQPGNVEAWRLLGTVHAENDDDQQAIAALGKALQADPSNPEVLLSLGVSHTNELDQSRALTYLMEWLKAQPGQAGAASVQLPRDAREKLRVVVDIFRTAAQMNAGSADAHVALGVLYNLSRDYDGAVGAFRTALQTRTADYSLWNKLGATLANSGRSGEAIGAYQKALDLKPNYMRAWTNMGISQANVGEYEASARYYVRALGLNNRAANVWTYLRTSLTCAGKNELLQAVDDEDLASLSSALPL